MSRDETSCIRNIQAADLGIEVLCAGKNHTTSTHTTDFTYSNIPPATRNCHTFLHLAPFSLLSIVQFCDIGYEV